MFDDFRDYKIDKYLYGECYNYKIGMILYQFFKI